MDRGTWLKAGAAAAGLVAAWAALYQAGLDPRSLSQQNIRSFVLSFGAWAPGIYLLTYGQPLVPLPASMLTIAGGLAFGPVWGTLAALFGATLRACGQLGVARWLGRDNVAAMLKGRVAELNEQVGTKSFKTVLLVRLIPNLPFDVQNYTFGFSRVKFWPFVLATFLGILPWTVAFVYFGDALADPRRFWKVMAGLLLIMGLMAATSRWRRRAPTAVIP